MRRIVRGLAAMVVAGCGSGPMAKEFSNTDFIRLSMFRIERADAAGFRVDPNSPAMAQKQHFFTFNKEAYEPVGRVLYSKSWLKLRGEDETDSWYRAFPRRDRKRKGELHMQQFDPDSLYLLTGVLTDEDMRRLIDDLMSFGLAKLRPLEKEIAPEEYRRLRETPQVQFVQVIRIETPRIAFEICQPGLMSNLKDPLVQKQIAIFVKVESRLLAFMSGNCLHKAVVLETLNPDRLPK